jgi:polysaccharide pyruvyl transferase WcaK-like protein
VTVFRFIRAPERPATAPRVGLFGILGAGNIGNDAQMETVLQYLWADHPDAILDAMCTGPERLKSEYGIEAIPLHWHAKSQQTWQGRARQGRARQGRPGIVTAAARTLRLGMGIGVNTFRMASWVRRHDVVIVPGAGVLETSTLLRPWETPYAMFLLCASGRIFGTKVALVSVGANVISQRLTGWLLNSSARLAYYRSYRDTFSRDAMRQRGVDTTKDHICPDLVFGIPVPSYNPGDPHTVGVGVMAYYGTNDDRKQAGELHASYIEKTKSFVRWLADSGHRVQLLIGDTNGGDNSVVQEILADLRENRPDLDPAQVVAVPTSSFAELTQAMALVGTVVAIRYHNVMCALKLGKPTISISYSPKSNNLMADMGLSKFCQNADSLDVDRLIKQFTELEEHATDLGITIAQRCEAKAEHLNQEFAVLSAALFPSNELLPQAVEERKSTRGGGR